LPTRPRFQAQSGDSRGRNSKSMSVFADLDGGNLRNVSRPEKIISENVLEFVPILSLTI